MKSAGQYSRVSDDVFSHRPDSRLEKKDPKSSRKHGSGRSSKQRLSNIEKLRANGNPKQATSFFHPTFKAPATGVNTDNISNDVSIGGSDYHTLGVNPNVNYGIDEPYRPFGVNRTVYRDVLKLALPEIPRTDVDYVIKQPKSFGASSIDEVWSEYAVVLYASILNLQMFAQAVYNLVLKRDGKKTMDILSYYLYDYKMRGANCVDHHCSCKNKRACMTVDIYSEAMESGEAITCPLFHVRCFATCLKLCDIWQTYAFWLSQRRNASKYCQFDGYVNAKTGALVLDETCSLTQQVYKTLCMLRKICRIVEFDPRKDSIYAIHSLYNASIQVADLNLHHYQGFLNDAKTIVQKAYDTKKYEFIKCADLLTVMRIVRNCYVCGGVSRSTRSWRWMIESLKDRLSSMVTDIFDKDVLNLKHLVEDVDAEYTTKTFKNAKELWKYFSFDTIAEESIEAPLGEDEDNRDVEEIGETRKDEIEKEAQTGIPQDNNDCDTEVSDDDEEDLLLALMDDTKINRSTAKEVPSTSEPLPNVTNTVHVSPATTKNIQYVSDVLISDANDEDGDYTNDSVSEQQPDTIVDAEYVRLTKLFDEMIISDEKSKEAEVVAGKNTNAGSYERTGGDHMLTYFGIFDANAYESYGYLNNIPESWIYDGTHYRERENPKEYIAHRQAFVRSLIVFFKLWFVFKLFNISEQLEADVQKHYIRSFVSKYDVKWYEYEGKNALENSKRRVSVDPERMLDRMYCSLSKTVKNQAHVELEELHENHRTLSRFGGFSDWYRISISSSSIATTVHKFFAGDSNYVLHQNQWITNMKWFESVDFPFIYYHDGRYKVYHNGRNVNYTLCPTDLKKMIDNMLSEGFDLADFSAEKRIDNDIMEKITMIATFWKNTKAAIVEKNAAYFYDIGNEKLETYMLGTVFLANRSQQLDEHCYDDRGMVALFDAITCEWYHEIHSKTRTATHKQSNAFEREKNARAMRSELDFGNIVRDYERLFGETLPLNYELDKNIDILLTERDVKTKTTTKSDHTPFEDAFEKQYDSKFYDTAYETLCVWILLVLDHKSEPELAKNVKHGLIGSIKGLILWCEKMNSYSNEDVLKKMSESSLYKDTYDVDRFDDDEGEDDEEALAHVKKKKENEEKAKAESTAEIGVEIYETDYEAFKTNNLGMSLKSDELENFLRFTKLFVPTLQGVLKYLNNYDYA